MKVKLTLAEMMLAAQVGVMRQVNNKKHGRSHRYGATDSNAWQIAIEGALGEAALAKALGVYWSGNIGRLSAADVGGIEIRTTPYRQGCLILHPGDQDEAAFFLAVGCQGDYEIKGWIRGAEGKQDRFWKDPTGAGRWAFFVPQGELRGVEMFNSELLMVNG